MDDVILNKVATIEKCIGRVRDEYDGNEKNLVENITKQDAIILNIQRACEAAIDMAMHLVRVYRLGIPQETRGAFELLAKGSYLKPLLADRLQKMVGFRNTAVHDYQSINLAIVKAVIETGLDDLLKFGRVALALQPTA